MSEDRPIYDTGQKKLPPGTLKRFTDLDYQAPSWEDVRTLKAMSGMTGKELSALVGIKGDKTFRRWTMEPGQRPPDQPEVARQIPYSAWRLLLLELCIVDY